MAVYTYPSSNHFLPARLEWGIRSNVIVNTARFSGSVERLELPGTRWIATITYAEADAASADAAEREAFWMKVRGQTNLAAIWHLFRDVPRGTLRGSPSVRSDVAQGATVLPISTVAGYTALPGDMVKSNGMLFMAVAAATANGSGEMDLSVTPPARTTITSSTALTWDKPTATFMLTGEPRIPYEPGKQANFSVDLVEVW